MCLRCSTQGFIGKGLRLHLSALIHPAVSPIKTAHERITNDADHRVFASPICVADRPGSSTSDCYRSVISRALPLESGLPLAREAVSRWLSTSTLVVGVRAGLERTWTSVEPEGSMSIRDERRAEPRTELHRLWTVSVESDRLGQRRAQVLDYSASGIKLALDGVCDLRPGASLEIHYPGTGWSYQATIAWTKQDDTETILGARLLEAACSLRQAC